MELNKAYQDMIQSANELEKHASALTFFGGLAAGEAVMKGISSAGKSMDANLLRAGIELGRKGEKMHPYKETLSRNLLGNRQLSPYESGQAIGKRMQEMDPEKEERFLNKVVGMASARKNNHRSFRDDPTLTAIENYQIGRDLKHPGVQSFLEAGSKPVESSGRLATLAANATTAPGGLLDFRLAARPLARFTESNKPAQRLGENLLAKTPVDDDKIKTGYNIARNYID